MNCSVPGFLVLHHFSSLLKPLSVESVMPSNHLILCCPFCFCLRSFPASGFLMSWLFALSDQSIGASASVLPGNIKGWFPLGWTGLIALQSKGLKSLVQHHSSRASILECEVKWALGNITTNKTSGRDGILTELFKILKDDAIKVCLYIL